MGGQTHDSKTQVLGIGYVVVFVRKWEDAVRFYTDGLRVGRRDDERGFREFRMPDGGPSLMIEDVGKAEVTGAVVGRFVGLTMKVPDIQATYKLWSGRGVRFEGPPTLQPWGGILAHFFDPDGNMWSLVEKRN